MHEEHEDLQRIKELKRTLIHWMEAETAKGARAVDCAELGAVVDMIKDLCEAENNCREAAYHKSVTDAMEDYQPTRMGYTPSRRVRRDRNRDRDMNRDTVRTLELQEPYDDGTWDYTSKPQRSRYDTTFDEYRRAKRHYTQTRSEDDKRAMNERANEHFMDTVATLREIWGDADIGLKQRMKADMTKLVGEMTV